MIDPDHDLRLAEMFLQADYQPDAPRRPTSYSRLTRLTTSRSVLVALRLR